MKKYLLISYILFLLAIVLYSCQPDNVTPNSDDTRDKIVDTWNCSENSTEFGQQAYQVDIAIDPNYSDRVILDNFFGLGTGKDVYAKMSGYQLTIPSQIVTVSQYDKWTFAGSGTISSNYKTISLNYTADNSNGAKPVTATYTLPN